VNEEGRLEAFSKMDGRFGSRVNSVRHFPVQRDAQAGSQRLDFSPVSYGRVSRGLSLWEVCV